MNDPTLTLDDVLLAARMRKVIKLAKMPGMDAVAVKLNSELTYDEQQEARQWWLAIEIARSSRAYEKPVLFRLAQLYAERLLVI